MIELRWKEVNGQNHDMTVWVDQGNESFVLQFRQQVPALYTTDGTDVYRIGDKWSEWQDVPTVREE